MDRPSFHPGLRVPGCRVLPAVLILATVLWGAVTAGHGHVDPARGSAEPALRTPVASDAAPAPCPLCRLALQTVCAADPDEAVVRDRPSRTPAERAGPDVIAMAQVGTKVPRGPPLERLS